MPNMNNIGTLPPKDDPHQVCWNPPDGSEIEDENVFSPLALKFGWNPPTGSREDDENVKKFTCDAQRTKSDHNSSFKALAQVS